MSTWYALQQHTTLHNWEISTNQFCNVKNYYVIGEITSKEQSYVM